MTCRAPSHPTAEQQCPGPKRPRLRLSVPLILLAVAISCYLASQVGVSSWLVRFLEPAPLATATLALALYWAGIAAGRLVSSQLADRFEHRRFTVACCIGLGIVVLAAIVARRCAWCRPLRVAVSSRTIFQ